MKRKFYFSIIKILKIISEFSSRYYKLKPKNIIAVTGTNEKTSIAEFYNQILSLNNKKVAQLEL